MQSLADRLGQPRTSERRVKAERYLCVHGHFYQPPRENPWLEAVEEQDGAYPFHDWNERITAECYRPNAASRILDAEGRIHRIVNNYARISYNVGPTLLGWMERHAKDVYQAVLDADRQSAEYFSGHGSAMAQPYGHAILPLCNSRDKRTQIAWGVRDFTHRFGRAPEGAWLPETAVDLESLDLLAEFGVRFTVLAPHQALAVRSGHGASWQSVEGARVDPKRPYFVTLPSGRPFAVFFYDGPVSRAVAFEGLLSNGERFAQRLLSAFSDDTGPQLVSIATDGETYGHHHRHGDMALAFALSHIEERGLARLTNYGDYLEKFPPTWEVQLASHTAWSCAHGVERWKSDCGCRIGGPPTWNQRWRGPLREAFDHLRDRLVAVFERHAQPLLRDPWGARDAYIDVVLDRSKASVDAFLERHATGPLDAESQTRALQLLEMQRHALLMFTSCGWFFDDVSGIETVQIIRYAGRALQLAEKIEGDPLSRPFLEELRAAQSNVAEARDAGHIYESSVLPAIVTFEKVAAHFAVQSMFEDGDGPARVYAYELERMDEHSAELGRTRLAVGKVRIRSRLTRDTADLSYGFLHFGDHNFSGGVKRCEDATSYDAMRASVVDAFRRADLASVLAAMDEHFGGLRYSLSSLFRDEQRAILRKLLASSVEEAETIYFQLYEAHGPLMRFLGHLDVPLPEVFRGAAAAALNIQLRRELLEDHHDVERIRSLFAEAKEAHIAIDTASAAFVLEGRLARDVERWRAEPTSMVVLDTLLRVATMLSWFPFEVDVSRLQNVYYGLSQSVLSTIRRQAEAGDATALAWLTAFEALGVQLRMKIDSGR